MGKQQNIIKNNTNQIQIWHIENRPTDWIAKQLKVSRETLKKIYPDYKGNQGGKQTEFSEEYKQYILNPKKCKQCGENIPWNKKRRSFCNHTCCAKFNNARRERLGWTEEQKQSFSLKQKIRFENGFRPKRKHGRYSKPLFENKICVVCRVPFLFRSSKPKKTCSTKCLHDLRSNNSKSNPNCGGETNYKRYTYNNVLMDSSWEVNLAKFLDLHNIKWIRSRKLLLYWTDEENKKRRYYPDFYLPDLNLYLDPKNSYKLKQDQLKLEKVQKENNIRILTGDVENITSILMGTGTA